MTKYLLLVFVLSGCATTYGPQGITGGYTAKQLQYNTFNITFDGNGYTDAETVDKFALLHAAETTLAAGYTHFGIVSRKLTTMRTKLKKQIIVRYHAELVIVCFGANIPNEALDAEETVASIRKER